MASTRPDPLLAGTIALNHTCDSNQVAAACGGGAGCGTVLTGLTVLTADLVDFVDVVDLLDEVVV
jgi:hypothetical protein